IGAAPPTILCVDDEPNILSSLRRLFRPHGYRVLTADGGAAGLALLESETVDLVISDMRMPHMDGAQFLAQVRQRWPGTIRLLLTGYADIQSILDAINQGEIFALLGSSGCGKSTLLRMLAGFETPTSGRIALAGSSIVDVPPHQRPINMMFQSYALFPHLSVWDNIAFGLRRDGLPKAEVAARVEQMLALVQLGQYAKRKPHQLSGGQQQRVALARSLAKRPQLLLLDEPLGALDKKLRERTQMELVNIIEQVGVTCVMVTHDQGEAMAISDRILLLNNG
ncbi:MAG: ATP-binding cassette domain-containing protein, partial [Janthinobacterium sp.]